MWSLFSRDPTKDFGYEVGDTIPGLEDQSIWHLHQGKKKGTGDPVSIFVFDVKNSSESQVSIAKASMKRIKTLRHPNILSYLDGLESEKVLYIVTESVVPLDVYLRENQQKPGQNELAIAWGLHQITKGLSFLNNDCNLIHNNVCMACVYVDKAGEWRLGGVDYMYPASGSDCLPPVKILPSLEKYDPPEKTGGGGIYRPIEKWSTDMWGLGCLIWEIYNGNLPKTSSLKTLGNIPKNLVPNYAELVGANPKSRPNPAKFLESCKARYGFMSNKFLQTMLFLEEIQIKDATEKTQFFNGLTPVLDTFPESFCKHKILPQLINAFEYGNAGSAVLQPLFKLGKLLDTDEYQKKIVPCVVKLFSSTDRATRVKLLQQVENFVEHLSPDIVNSKIFPSICQGFNDTNPIVREHTIKGMMHLAAKLNYKNLNEELLKHFARLQTKDDQGGIRTNTTICLGKIAGHLNPQMRQKVLCSAYLRAMKDPFPPARQAGVIAMAATHNFFTLRESATRLMPALCSMTMDPEKMVRDQAFKAIRCFMSKLEKVSEKPELTVELERDVLTGGSAASAAASWAGWAVSSITSKIYKGKPKSTGSSSPQKTAVAATATEETTKIEATPVTLSSKVIPAINEEVVPSDEDDKDYNENDGWEDDDDWGDMEDDVTDDPRIANQQSPGDGWDEEDWASLDEQPPQPVHKPQLKVEQSVSDHLQVKKDFSPWGQADFAPVDGQTTHSASSFNWGQEAGDDNFFSNMLTCDEKKKPGKSRPPSSFAAANKSSKLSAFGATAKEDLVQPDLGKSKTSNTWNSWESDEWGNSACPDSSKGDDAKRHREEKRLQRQKEMEEKRAARQTTGALKLGARKLAND